MKEVLVRTKPKDSFTLVVSDNSANIQAAFNPPLYLQANRNYELAMVNLGTYYSFVNIRGDNNLFKWSVDDIKIIHHVPTGYYELKDINAEITRIRGNSDITIPPNVNTLQCILTVVGAKCKVNFDVPNSLASVLDFKQNTVYGVGRHASENLVNIMQWQCRVATEKHNPNSRTIPGFSLKFRKFQDFQGLSRTCGNPAMAKAMVSI